MNKTIDYYMALPYTIEVIPDKEEDRREKSNTIR
jgi:hypothetical protein